MTDLQDHLFESLELLKSGEMRPEVAREVCNIGNTLLNSAKVEMKYMDMLGVSRAQSPLLAGIGEAPAPAPKQLAEPVITWRCANHLCAWEGKQKEKQLVRDGANERRVCPGCTKEVFHMLVNGVVQG